MGRKLIDLTGKKFGRLTVIKRVENIGSVTMYKCKCECGKVINVRQGNLKNGQKSCGCYSRELFKSEQWSKINSSHGYCNHELYQTWNSMMRRCNDVNNSDYKNYGGRGIKVCSRWNTATPEIFIQDIEGKLGKRPKNHTLDRIDNNGDYEINNVKWSSRSEQCVNQRSKDNKLGEKYIIQRRGGYIVAISRDKNKIFSNKINSLERAKEIREYYLKLYEENKRNWEKVCKERKYIKK